MARTQFSLEAGQQMAGHETVAEAMGDVDLAAFVGTMMQRDILPTIKAPRGLDLPVASAALIDSDDVRLGLATGGLGTVAEYVSWLPDLDEHVLRDRILGELNQRCRDLGGGDPGRAGVPNREGRNPVGVNVLGRLDKLGEPGERVAGPSIVRARNFRQDVVRGR